MEGISTVDARALFTKALIDVYQERIAPTAFLRSFFPTVAEPTKEISIEVERMGEQIAVDVLRGTEGNRNQFTKSTEKVFLPPFFREYMDATELQLYDRVLGSQGNAQAPLFAALLNSVSTRLGYLQDKIERSIELMCSQVLETGVVTLTQGIAASIDYKRKAASLVDTGGGTYWVTTGVDVFGQIESGCNFLRQVGRSADGMFNLILGSQALTDLLTNSVFLARQNLFNMALDQVQGPMRGANGMTFHGVLTVGSYKVQLWAYPQFYDANTGTVDAPVYTSTPYINPKKIILLPLTPRFKCAFAAVPQVIGNPGALPTQGAYVMGEYVDERNTAHIFDIKSAPLPIPIAVDTIYTRRVVA